MEHSQYRITPILKNRILSISITLFVPLSYLAIAWTWFVLHGPGIATQKRTLIQNEWTPWLTLVEYPLLNNPLFVIALCIINAFIILLSLASVAKHNEKRPDRLLFIFLLGMIVQICFTVPAYILLRVIYPTSSHMLWGSLLGLAIPFLSGFDRRTVFQFMGALFGAGMLAGFYLNNIVALLSLGFLYCLLQILILRRR